MKESASPFCDDAVGVSIPQMASDSFEHWHKRVVTATLVVSDTEPTQLEYGLNFYEYEEATIAGKLADIYTQQQVLESHIKLSFGASDDTPYDVIVTPKPNSTTVPLSTERSMLMEQPYAESGIMARMAGKMSMISGYKLDDLAGIKTLDQSDYMRTNVVSDGLPGRAFSWFVSIDNSLNIVSADPLYLKVELFYRVKWSRLKPIDSLLTSGGLSGRHVCMIGRHVVSKEELGHYQRLSKEDKSATFELLDRSEQVAERVITEVPSMVLPPPSVSAMSRTSSRSMMR